MPAVGNRAAVPPIASEPSPHGLLGGCVEVVYADNPHQLMGTDMQGSSCAQANAWQDCPDPSAGWTNPASKTFDRPDQCSFAPWTAYASVECSTIGLTREELNQRALDQLARGEQRVWEQQFMRFWLAPTVQAAATDLTPAAGALHIAQGVGALESWLGTNFGGQGVIHAPIGTAALLSMNTLVDFATEETCPRTLAGSSIILGAGYAANVGPDGTPAPAGESWLYITPPLRVRRDQPFLVETGNSYVNTRTNDQRALAESTAVIEVACCMAAAVRVSLTACP